MIIYEPKGVCSKLITINLKDDIVESVKFTGGCAGNAQGISNLVVGMHKDEVIKRLEGINCGSKPTSCPAQLAQALKE